MKTFHITVALIAICLGVTTSPTRAQQARHPMDQFLDTNTIGFARINLKSFDFDPISQQISNLPNSDQPDIARLSKIVRSLSEAQSKFRDAGAQELFMFLSLDDIQSYYPFVAISHTNSSSEELKAVAREVVTSLVKESQLLVVSDFDNILFIGPQPTLERIRANRLPRRNDATQLLDLASAPFSFVVAPSEDHQRVLTEIFDRLPEPFEAVSGKKLVNGMQFASLSFDPSEFKLDLHISGKTPESIGSNQTDSTHEIASKILEVLNDANNPLYDEFSTSAVEAMSLIELDKSQPAKATLRLDPTRLKQFSQTWLPQIAKRTSTSGKQFRKDSVRSLAIAMHNYYDAYRSFPKNIVDKDGKPILSWRVQLLRFMEYDDLYKQFKFDEPWDSDHNKKLITKMPRVFQTEHELTQQGKTVWTIPEGEHYFGSAHQFGDIRDGTSNTIMIIGVAPEASMIWTQPTDWAPDPENILKGIFSVSQTQTAFACGDGSNNWFSDKTAPKTLMKLLTIDDGEITEEGEIK